MSGSENTSDTVADGGIMIGKSKSGSRAPKTKDRNGEKFWTFLAETTAACKAKAENQK